MVGSDEYKSTIDIQNGKTEYKLYRPIAVRNDKWNKLNLIRQVELISSNIIIIILRVV